MSSTTARRLRGAGWSLALVPVRRRSKASTPSPSPLSLVRSMTTTSSSTALPGAPILAGPVHPQEASKWAYLVTQSDPSWDQPLTHTDISQPGRLYSLQKPCALFALDISATQSISSTKAISCGLLGRQTSRLLRWVGSAQLASIVLLVEDAVDGSAELVVKNRRFVFRVTSIVFYAVCLAWPLKSLH